MKPYLLEMVCSLDILNSLEMFPSTDICIILNMYILSRGKLHQLIRKWEKRTFTEELNRR